MIVARAPNHLGDGVMALPALHALAELDRLRIHAPPWGPDLYRGVEAEVVGLGRLEGDVAVLFAPSWRAAWEARRCAVRIGLPTDRGHLLRSRGSLRASLAHPLITVPVAPGGHRADEYRRLAEAAGATVRGDPAWAAREDDPRVDVPPGHVGLNPVSRSGRVVQWPGFPELARRLAPGGPVVFYGGPGEEAAVDEVAAGHPRVVGLPLPAFASALARCRVFVSNDSGAAHFARACGVPTVVVFGSTTPARTGPAGALAVEGPALPCRPCYRKTCRHELGCLSVPAHRVVDAIGAAAGG